MERKRGPIPSAKARKRGKRGKEKVDDIDSQEPGPSFVDLPFPITADILLRLSSKLILICKRVCRTWNTVISDPHFTKLHFERSSTGFLIQTCDPKLVSRTMYLLEGEPPEFDSGCINILKLPTLKVPLLDAKLVFDKQLKLEHALKLPFHDKLFFETQDGVLVCSTVYHDFNAVNSCNGLLCLCEPFNNDPFVVCNPVTGEFIRLPKVIYTSKRTLRCGIGFHTKTNEYKVVRIVDGILNVEINVVGTPTWRQIRVDGNFSSISRLKYPTFVNEALHWICYAGEKYSILHFSFETEKLQLIDLPYATFFQLEDFSMGALGDSLYIFSAYLPGPVDHEK